MGVPGIITGGDGTNLFRQTTTNSQPLSRQGVFGRNPGSTAKWASNRPRGIDAENREGMARLFVEIPANSMEAFLATVSAETRPLARVLATASDGSGTGGTGFLDFLLTNAQEDFQEKAQIVDTLTDNYVAFYSGQVPPVFQYSGTLLNTYQDDQRVWMLRLYREILRGTRLASRNLIARLRYDSFIVSGYLENLRLSLRGETEHTASKFSFSMRVKRLNIFTVALGAPTVAQTVATTNSILSGEAEQRDAAARIGGVTPETPETPSASPGAGVTALTEAEQADVRQALRATLTDEQIDAVIARGNPLIPPPQEDPRETAVRSRAEGTQRVSESVQGTDIEESNPNNVTQDGSGGDTNVFGPGAFTMFQEQSGPTVLTATTASTLPDASFQTQILQQRQRAQSGDASTSVFPLRSRETPRRRGGARTAG